ncbi:hypothetical protein [Enterococcus olivae]
MSFKIKVYDAEFYWENGALHCTDKTLFKNFKELLAAHIPAVVVMPDMIDYDDDLTDERNAFLAINGIFPVTEISEMPADEIMFADMEENRIY